MPGALQQNTFLWLLLPLTAGIVCGDACHDAFSRPVLLWMAAGCLLVAAVCRVYRWRHGGRLTACTFLFCLGCMGTVAQWAESDYPFTGDESLYKVRIVEHGEEKPRSLLYHSVLLEECRGGSLQPAARRSLFLLYFPKDSLASTLRRGDELLIHARLSAPQRNGNPDEFDYVRFLRRRGGSGTAYVPAGHWQVVGHDSLRTLRQVASDCRERVVSMYRRLGFGGDELAVLSALTVGDKDDLSDGIVETYSVSGASHVLALSGLHIGFLYALLLFLLRPLWARWHRLKPALVLFTVVCLWAFAFVTGLSSSVVRSVTMFSLLALTSLQGGRPLTLHTLSTTAFLMLLFRPLWLFDVGFQLSFLAVLSIVLFQPLLYALWPVKQRFLRYVWGLATLSVAAQIGTAPLVLLYFSRFSTHFLLTNLWVVPMVSLVLYSAVVMLLLAPFPALQQLAAAYVERMVGWQNAGLRLIESFPYASIDGVWMDLWDVLLLYVFFALLYRCWVRGTGRNVCLMLAALLLFVSYHGYCVWRDSPRPGLNFYNVRHSPAVHCTTQSRVSWLVTADSVPRLDGLRRSLTPHWNRLHLAPPQVLADGDSCAFFSVHDGLFSYGGKRVCILHDGRWRGKRAGVSLLPVDYLYVCRGYKGTLEELSSLFAVKFVVLDASMTPFYRKRMKTECLQQHIPYYDLAEKGYLFVPL